MRRLFWCGAVAMVAVAAGFYFAADQATHSPRCLTGRSAMAAYRLGLQCNPLALVGAGLVQRAAATLQEVTRELASASAPTTVGATPCPGACPVPARPLLPAEPDGQRILDMIRPEVSLIQIDPQVIQLAQTAEPRTTVHKLAAVKEHSGVVEENEELPTTMPRCLDDDEKAAPAAMPYIEESAQPQAGQQIFDHWMALLRCAAAEAVARQASDPGTESSASEESETLDESHLTIDRPDSTEFHPQSACPHAEPVPTPAVEPSVTPEPGQEKKEQTHEGKLMHFQRTAPASATSDTGPAHEDVDTMEFRPSDAHAGEFENHPM